MEEKKKIMYVEVVKPVHVIVERRGGGMFLLKFILFFTCFPLFVLVWLLSE